MTYNFYEITAEGFEDLINKRETVKQGIDIEDLFVQREDYYIDNNNAAHIHIFGPLVRNASDFDIKSGMTSYKLIKNELKQALKDNVDYVILDIDSPGGEAMGTQELVDILVSYPLPVYSIIDSALCASAAYKLASATTGIYATKSSEIGSIGSIIVIDSTKEMMDRSGIKRQIFKNSDAVMKGMGSNFGELSESDTKYIQSKVEESGVKFQNIVKSNRPEVSDRVFNAEVFNAEQALTLGLIDGIINSAI